MKRIAALLLACLMAVCLLSACGGSASKSRWELEESVDEFGDVTEDSYDYLASSFTGTFSNTATSEGELSGKVGIARKTIGHYVVAFDLFENGDIKASFSDSDVCTLKIKVDEEIHEYSLSGYAPQGSLILGTDDADYSGDEFFNMLYNGSDLRCIIEIGSSSYNFTVENGNFVDYCKENSISAASAEMTVAEAVSIFLKDTGVNVEEANEVLQNHYNDYPRITSDDIINEAKGHFVIISTGLYMPYPDERNPQYLYPSMSAYEITDEGYQMISYFDVDYDNKASAVRVYADNSNRNPILSVSTKDDLIYFHNNEKDVDIIYQINKMTDNIYLWTLYDTNTKTPALTQLVVKYNEYGGDGILKALENAYQNEVPLIN